MAIAHLLHLLLLLLLLQLAGASSHAELCTSESICNQKICPGESFSISCSPKRVAIDASRLTYKVVLPASRCAADHVPGSATNKCSVDPASILQALRLQTDCFSGKSSCQLKNPTSLAGLDDPCAGLNVSRVLDVFYFCKGAAATPSTSATSSTAVTDGTTGSTTTPATSSVATTAQSTSDFLSSTSAAGSTTSATTSASSTTGSTTGSTTASTTGSTTGSTTASTTSTSTSSTSSPGCPSGQVPNAHGRCQSLNVSGEECRNLSATAPLAFRTDNGSCSLVPATLHEVNRTLEENQQASVRAQVLLKFANSQQFQQLEEVSGFSSLLSREMSKTVESTPASEETSTTLGDFLSSAASFASKGLWRSDRVSADERRGLESAAAAVLRAIDSLGGSVRQQRASATAAGIELSVQSFTRRSHVSHVGGGASVKAALPAGEDPGDSVAMATTFVQLPWLSRWLRPQQQQHEQQDEQQHEQELCSHVMQVSVHAGGRRLRSVSAVLLLPHLRPLSGVRRRCAFVQGEGELATAGCRVLPQLSNSSHTACACSHLTSFALLVAPSERWLQPDTHQLLQLHRLPLRVLTYACLAVSILCLLCTNVTYLLVKLHSPMSDSSIVTLHKVHHSLCFALMLAQSLFLVGFEPSAFGALPCKIVAAATLYAFLCVFCWILCEGFLYTKNLIVVLPGVDSAFAKVGFAHCCAVSYAVPAVIVGITAGVRHEQLVQFSPDLRPDSDELQRPAACWLSEQHGTSLAFLCPALLVCTVNLLVFLVILVKLSRRDASSQWSGQREGLGAVLRRQLKLSVTLGALLGLTWLLGVFFYFAELGFFVALQYAFVLLNGLQGGVIFATQVAGHHRVRDGWRRLLLQSRCTPDCLRQRLRPDSASGADSRKQEAAPASCCLPLRRFTSLLTESSLDFGAKPQRLPQLLAASVTDGFAPTDTNTPVGLNLTPMQEAKSVLFYDSNSFLFANKVTHF